MDESKNVGELYLDHFMNSKTKIHFVRKIKLIPAVKLCRPVRLSGPQHSGYYGADGKISRNSG